jgi:hypothetical protein
MTGEEEVAEAKGWRPGPAPRKPPATEACCVDSCVPAICPSAHCCMPLRARAAPRSSTTPHPLLLTPPLLHPAPTHAQGESELEEVEKELAEGRGSNDHLASYKDDDGSEARGFKGRPPVALGRAAKLLSCLVSPVRAPPTMGRQRPAAARAGRGRRAATAHRQRAAGAPWEQPQRASPPGGFGALCRTMAGSLTALRARPSHPSTRPLASLPSRPPLSPSPLAAARQIFFNAFILTFLAEWGDRSQIATIGLAASQDVVGVTLGSVIGHAACTAAAVLGGRHLAAHINERTVGVGASRARGAGEGPR